MDYKLQHVDILGAEDGAATIVEYTIVLPIVILAVLLLIVLGNMTYDKALLESAAERGALYASKVVADRNYANEAMFPKKSNLNEIDAIAMSNGKVSTNPYRYLTGLVSQPSLSVSSDVERIVRKGQLLRNDDVSANVKVVPGLSYKVVVDVSEEYAIPGMFKLFGLPPFATVSASSEVWVNEPAEFIRNADYAVEIVQKIGAATGITDKLNKLKSSIKFFFEKTKDGSNDG